MLTEKLPIPSSSIGSPKISITLGFCCASCKASSLPELDFTELKNPKIAVPKSSIPSTIIVKQPPTGTTHFQFLDHQLRGSGSNSFIVSGFLIDVAKLGFLIKNWF